VDTYLTLCIAPPPGGEDREQDFLRVGYGSGGCVELLHCGVSLFPKATLPVVLGGRTKMFRFGSKIRSRIQSETISVGCRLGENVPLFLSSNKSYLIDFIDAKNRDLTVPLRGVLSMFAARQRTGERRGVI